MTKACFLLLLSIISVCGYAQNDTDTSYYQQQQASEFAYHVLHPHKKQVEKKKIVNSP